MTLAPILEVADELVGNLNEQLTELDLEPVARRERVPRVKLKDMPALRVVVFPNSNVSEIDLTRKLREFDYEIQVLFQAKLGDPKLEEWDTILDDWVGTVDAIAEEYRGRVRMTETGAYPVLVEVSPVYDPQELEENNVFSSILTLTMRQERS
jgi:hypothetical protein